MEWINDFSVPMSASRAARMSFPGAVLGVTGTQINHGVIIFKTSQAPGTK